MEDKKKIFIAFLDDDDQKKEDWVELIDKNLSYVEFNYKGKILILPWHRIFKIKEVKE